MVPSQFTLYKLHLIIQEAFGWSNYHLHLFEVNGVNYTQAAPDEDWEEFESDDLDDKKFRLGDLGLSEKSRFLYTYDFGDGWDHEILVEKIVPPQEGTRYPMCLAGSRACPPEDCGGPYGYQDFVKAILNPRHKRHKELLEWIGGTFDPEAFDLDDINRGLIQFSKQASQGHGD
jgi:hypothetical protein